MFDTKQTSSIDEPNICVYVEEERGINDDRSFKFVGGVVSMER